MSELRTFQSIILAKSQIKVHLVEFIKNYFVPKKGLHYLKCSIVRHTQRAFVCAVGQRTHPAEVQSEPHLPSDVVLGQLVTERIGLENGVVLSFSS